MSTRWTISPERTIAISLLGIRHIQRDRLVRSTYRHNVGFVYSVCMTYLDFSKVGSLDGNVRRIESLRKCHVYGINFRVVDSNPNGIPSYGSPASNPYHYHFLSVGIYFLPEAVFGKRYDAVEVEVVRGYHRHGY